MFEAGRFAAGDREYVDQVVREYSAMVQMVCEAFAWDYDHAQDLFQETWSTVIVKADSFRGDGPFGAWLHRIATNVCISDLRSRKHRAEGLKRWARESEGSRSPVDPLNQTERREFRRALLRALPQLTDGEREALTLRVLEGIRPQEVAEIMGIAPATVRSHVRHALNRLRAMMEDSDNELSRYRAAP